MDIFSNLQVVGECLLDTKRVTAFRRSIQKNVSSKSTVLDAGTGSAILSIIAAKQGAKVHAVEIAPDVARVARQNVVQNKLQGQIKVIPGDITKIQLKPKFDTVLMEMLDTGLVAEQQARAIKHLFQKKNVDSKTTFLPSKVVTTIKLIDYNFVFYGNQLSFVIQARNSGVLRRINKSLSKPIVIDDVDFASPFSMRVKQKKKLSVTHDGTINAVLLESYAVFPDGEKVRATTDMLMPVIIPVQPVIKCHGQTAEVKINYGRGAGFGSVKIHVK